MFSSVSRWVNSNPRWLQQKTCSFNNHRNLPLGILTGHAHTPEVIVWNSAHDLAYPFSSALLSLSTTWKKTEIPMWWPEYSWGWIRRKQGKGQFDETSGTWFPFTSLYLCPLVSDCVKAWKETRVPVVETGVILWCFSLLLKHKSVALTDNINKRDRSSGYKDCYIIFLCNKRLWKEQEGYFNDPLDQQEKSVL